MNPKYPLLALAVAALLAPGPLGAQSAGRPAVAPLLPAAAGDQVVDRLARVRTTPAPHIERDPVRYAWAIDADTRLEPPAGHTAVSRAHWDTVDGAELARGLAVHTTHPGAMVLISPERGAAPVEPAGLRIGSGGLMLEAAAATDRSTPAAGLEAATGLPLSNGSLGFRIRPELGSGRFELHVPGASGRYVVHVHEPASPYVLKLQNPDTTRLAGDMLSLPVQLEAPAGTPPLRTLGGLLVAPDGRTLPIDGVATATGHHLVARLPADAGSVPGLWEVHAFAVGEANGQPLLRDAKVALQLAAPTARLQGAHTVGMGADGRLQVTLPVEVASPGRYEVRAVLMGSGADGTLRPAAVAHAADWLEPGRRSLALHFPAAVHEAVSAPYELRQLTLSDQGRHGRLEYRERAARISGIRPIGAASP